jgi:hypothetical protein
MVPLVSLSRLRKMKELQWERPRVWVPDRTTISSAVMFRSANPLMRPSAVRFGPGSVSARVPFETLPSRRPAGT